MCPPLNPSSLAAVASRKKCQSEYLPFPHHCEGRSLNRSRLFNNRELADVEISVGELVVPAHRLVLCLQCKYFSDALTGDFKEGRNQVLQGEPGKEQAYLRMLRYLYSGDYDAEPSTFISNDGTTSNVAGANCSLRQMQMILSFQNIREYTSSLTRSSSSISRTWRSTNSLLCLRNCG